LLSYGAYCLDSTRQHIMRMFIMRASLVYPDSTRQHIMRMIIMRDSLFIQFVSR